MSTHAQPGRPLLPGRRRAEEFARALDGGSPADPALAPLVALAQQLQALPLGPTDDFRDRLRTRLLAVAAVAPAEPAPARPVAALGGVLSGWRGQRRLALAAGSVAVVVGVAGVGVAGGRSLPGDPFYGVKRGGEALELATTHGLLARGRLHLRFARERLHEVGELAGTPRALGGDAPVVAGLAPTAATAPVAGAPGFGGTLDQRVVDTLRRMDADTLSGSADLTAVFRRSHDTSPLTELARFGAAQRAQLGALAPTLPAATQGAAAASLALLQHLTAATGDLLSAGLCTDACRPLPQPTPSAGPAAVPPAGAPAVPARACGCPTPAPAPPAAAPSAATPTATATPAPAASDAPAEPSPAPSATPASRRPSPAPSPSPSPSPSSVVDQVQKVVRQLPLPVPVPTLSPPVPLPTASRPAGITLP